ncbi:MAG: DNA primase [Syntrophorhabdaceae bacterium]|nr:DNA primase [Syntrophorhabdaceae bacterium]
MGGRISETTIHEVRDRTDIIEVISETVPLTRAGANYRGLCPFHHEKTPSFFVNPARQTFKCFGCNEGGSVFHFLMKARNLSFADAVEELAERYGVEVRYDGGRPHARPGEDLYEILRLAAGTYRELLGAPSGKAAREFMKMRGVTEEAGREFFIGWSGRGGELLAALKKAGIAPERAETAGLLVSSDRGRRERFRGRVLFPVADARGRVCGFGGRALDDSIPKYINSPESDLYRKNSLLYGLHQALPSIRRDGRVVVVEGYMDLVGLWQKGIRSVVATCGTALTENHARTLKRLSENVILLYDGDKAGKMAAVRSGGPLYSAGVSPKVIFPPKGMDPDDWAKAATAEDLVKEIESAEPLMEYIDRGVSRKCNFDSTSGKLDYVKSMDKYLRWIPDSVERELYVQRVAGKTELSVDTIRRHLFAASDGAGRKTLPEEKRAAAKDAFPEESRLLQLFALDPLLAKEAAKEEVGELLADPVAREALDQLAGISDSRLSSAPASLLTESLPDAVRNRLAAEIVRGEYSADKARKEYPAVVRALRFRAKEREVKSLEKQLKSESIKEEKQALFERLRDAVKEKERLQSEL